MLQAVRFADKKVAGLNLGIDEDFQAAQCFTEIIRGYNKGVVQPCVMLGLQATGAVRATLEVIIPVSHWTYPGAVEANRYTMPARLAIQL